MQAQAKRIYEFGPFRLDVGERRLLRDGRVVPLTPKAFEVLLLLVESGGHTVKKDELINRVWVDSFVEEGNLKVTVSMLRKALEDDADKHHYVETVPRRGYRFAASVRELTGEETELVTREQIRSSITIEESDEQREPRTLAAVIARKPRPLLLMIAGAAVIAIAVAVYLWLRKLPAPVAGTRSIAVLPFKPLAADLRDESLEMGMADTLITRLSGIKQLSVRPLSAVRKYSGLEQDAVAAGREQQVETVLDGSIQRADDQIRVTVRLVSTADGRQLWAAHLDEKFTDILALEDSISHQVASALAVKLSGGEKELLTKHYTDDAQAYSLYLKGRYFWNKRTPDAIHKSIDYFNQAIKQDPDYALAFLGLADAYLVLPNVSEAQPQEMLSKAKAAAQEALQIDSQLPEAHTTLAGISSDFEWNWQEAESQFNQALEMNPNYATAHQWYGEYLDHAGQSDEAIRELKRAQELDPLSLIINTSLGQAYYHARQYDEAIDQFQKTLDLDPNFANAHLHLGLTYLQKKLYEQAIPEFQKARDASGNATNIVALLGTAYWLSGNRSAAQKIIDQLTGLFRQQRAEARDLAIIYTGLGDKDRAEEWMERAYRDHSWLMLLIKSDPYFDPLRTDARFQDLLNRIGL